MVVEKNLPTGDVNFMKALASQFQVDTQAVNMKHSKLNNVPQGDQQNGVYKTSEVRIYFYLWFIFSIFIPKTTSNTTFILGYYFRYLRDNIWNISNARIRYPKQARTFTTTSTQRKWRWSIYDREDQELLQQWLPRCLPLRVKWPRGMERRNESDGKFTFCKLERNYIKITIIKKPVYFSQNNKKINVKPRFQDYSNNYRATFTFWLTPTSYLSYLTAEKKMLYI